MDPFNIVLGCILFLSIVVFVVLDWQASKTLRRLRTIAVFVEAAKTRERK